MTEKSAVPVQREKGAEPREAQPAAWPRLGSLRDEIERLFDAFEPRLWAGSLTAQPGAVVPAMDLVENGKAWVLTLELPGMKPEDIEVRLANGMLSISGEKAEEKKEEGEDYHLSERRWGSFRRAIRLPEGADAAAIEASHANGVLTIRLPKSEKALAAEKKIDVTAA